MTAGIASPRRSDDLPPMPDLWAPVQFAELPRRLVEAHAAHDWPTVAGELRALLDGIITDGKYGRELLQLVRTIPFEADPYLARHRAAAAIDHGDWDDLRRYFAILGESPTDLVGLSSVITAPPDRASLPPGEPHHLLWFTAYERQLQCAEGAFRHRIRRLFGRHHAAIWKLDYVSVNRFLQYRSLHDAVFGAVAEAHAGRLPVAVALAREALGLDVTGEPLHVLIKDLELPISYAAGGAIAPSVFRTPDLLASPVGLSPYGSWEFLHWLTPFFAVARRPDLVAWSAELQERIGTRMGSPRVVLQGRTWRVAAGALTGGDSRHAARTELPALLAQAHGAAPGLRALPELLGAIETHRPLSFALAERLARRAGNTWMQMAALTWLLAVKPDQTIAKRYTRLLEITGWRRPALVPKDICADASIALAALGLRSPSIVQLAAASGRPAAILVVTRAHLDDASASQDARVAAVEALMHLGSEQSRDALARVARGSDEAASRARGRLAAWREHSLLTDREAEVLELAGKGLTNKQIGQTLFLSPHTVARHLANARVKLGASNRAEAAVRAWQGHHSD